MGEKVRSWQGEPGGKAGDGAAVRPCSLWVAVVLNIAAAVGLLVFLILTMPRLLPVMLGHAANGDITPTLVVSASLSIVGGIGGVVLMVVSYRKQKLNEQIHKESQREALEQRFIQLVGTLDGPDQQVSYALREMFYISEKIVEIDERGSKEPKRVESRRERVSGMCESGLDLAAVTTRKAKPELQRCVNIACNCIRYQSNRMPSDAALVQLEMLKILGESFDRDPRWSRCDFRLSNVTFWCPVNIDGCQISGAVDFTSARFAEGFSARETRFSTVFFEGAAFEGAQARFVNAIFEGNAFFGTTLFQSEADFTGARFLKPVSFSRASVTSDCGPTIVSKDLVEKMKGGAIFRGAASFDNVMFADKADFTETSFKDVSFEDATAKEIMEWSGN